MAGRSKLECFAEAIKEEPLSEPEDSGIGGEGEKRGGGGRVRERKSEEKERKRRDSSSSEWFFLVISRVERWFGGFEIALIDFVGTRWLESIAMHLRSSPLGSIVH